MSRRATRPSLASVALKAKVSPATASLILSGRGGDYRLSEETSTRVLAAARALGYTRSTKRRGPARIHVVHLEDLLRMDARGLGGAILHPLLDALTARGWLASVDPRLPADPDSAGAVFLGATAVVVPVNIGFDAVARSLIAAASARGVQPVVIGRHLPGLEAIQIDGEQDAGGRLAAEHLLALGHRHIATIAGSTGDPHTEARLAGFTAACAGRGAASRRIDAWGEGGYDAAGAYALVAGRLAAGTRPTALFCCNDRMALGALLALREAGLRVPQDVSLVGFDDQAEYSAIPPGLTTVRIDAGGIGTQVASLLAAGNAVVTRRIAIPARLVARGSTGPAPSLNIFS